MGRYRVFATLGLLLLAVACFATDYRLVIASDDPATRKAAAIVIFEPSGRLTKDDRITSITFSASAEVKDNCLVSLDPASGKTALALSPDVEVYQGKVMMAGSKPTRKVIPAHIEIDTPVAGAKPAGKLSSVMQPIIQQVNNLPWVYIGLGVGIFMAVMYFMNRRSYQFTTSMSKEAKSLYLETVGRISDRLDRIEMSQERLVKNPPVVRTFKAQIEDFEGRLIRIEKLAKEGKEEMGRAAAELSQSDKKHDDLVGRIESAKGEASKTQANLKQEADALRSELKLLLKSQDEASSKLGTLEELKTASLQIAEQNRQLEVKLAAQEELLAAAQAEHGKQLQQLQAELATVRANQEALLAMPKELEMVSASIAKMPAEFDSVRSAMPRLDGIETKLDTIAGFGSKFDRFDGVEARLDSIAEFGPKLDRFDSVEARLDTLAEFGPKFDEISHKLEALPEIKDSLETLPSQFPQLGDEIARIHESLQRQIEGLTGKIDDSGASLGELISAHSFATPEPEATSEEAPVEAKKSKKGKGAKVEEPEVALEEIPVAEEEAPEVVAEVLTEEAVLEEEPEAIAEEPQQSVKEVAEPEAVVVEEPTLEDSPEEALEQPSEFIAEEEAVAEVADAEVVEAEVENFEAPEAVAEMPEGEAFELTSEPIDFEAPVQEEEPVEAFDESAQESLELVVDEEPEMELTLIETPEELVAEVEESPSLIAEAKELEYRYVEPDAPVVPEFHFSNAIKRMAEEEMVVQIQEDSHKAGKEAPLSFHLDTLPDHLETFEDEEADAVLPTLHVDAQEHMIDSKGAKEAVESVLRQLDQPKSAAEDLEAFDQEDDGDAHMGHWNGLGGSNARTWGSDSSLPLELVSFQGELKPLTPIETAPPGDLISGMVYGFGRVVYACGTSVRGFWPGRDERQCNIDLHVPADEWRLALRGQNLFVAGEKRVKIVSVQSWFVLEQFSGEYQDQLLTETRWVGLRHESGPVLDFRDFRGQMAAEGVRLDAGIEGLQLCANEKHVFAASKDGRVMRVSEFGTEAIGQGPEGAELLHLTVYDNAPLAILRSGNNLECWHFGEQTRSASLDMASFDGHPVLLGNKLYLADVAKGELVSLNLKKMQRSSSKAFEGVEGIRRMIGVQHKSQHELFVITTDAGKPNGRVLMVDAKSGHETTFGFVGHSNVNLICADHHLVLSTSSQYQNVIRVLEPFSQRVAA